MAVLANVIGKEGAGLVFSASLHIGVVIVALVGLPRFSKDRPNVPPPISIEFVRIEDRDQILAPAQEEAPPQEQTRQESAQTLATAEPEVVEAEAVPLPAEATPEVAVPTPKPKPKPQVSENRQLANRIIPQAKPKPPSRLKSNAISQRLTALLDKSKQEQEIQNRQAEEEKQAAAEKKQERLDPLAALRGTVATASLMSALRQKVEQNWSFPGGAKGIENMQVTVRIWIRPDGSFSRLPEFLDAGNLNDPDRAFFRIFAESARRAVLLSEPFDEAAQHLESNQKYIDFVFSGAEFAGK